MSALKAATRGIGPHAGQRLVTAGAPLGRARLALVMAHGRGGAPEDMVGLADHLALPDLAVLAPAAAGHSWWPDSFLAPLQANEPGLSSGLSVISALLDDLAVQGYGPERVVLAGFSQGACLAIEAAAPPLAELYDRPGKRFDYDGQLIGVPILLGCHEQDPHIPLARVHQSARVLEDMGAEVDTILIPGAGHGIVADEAAWLRKHLNDKGETDGL